MRLGRKVRILSIVLVAFVLSVSIHYIWDMDQTQRVFHTFTKTDKAQQYTINAVFDEENMMLRGEQKTYYQNTSNKAIKDIYFHLYANAFKNNNSAPFEPSEMVKAYPNGFDEGWIKLNRVMEGNKKVSHKVLGEGNTNLRVTPNTPIKPGESIELTMDFELKLPNSVGRMGYGENTVNIANWYPILSVLDKNGWNLEPYYSIGDPFYSDVAEYHITMTIPEKYELATTGNILKSSIKDNKKTYRIHANNVRDFTMILSENFIIDRGNVDGTEVISYTIDGLKDKEALKYGMDSLEIFNRLFGKYPYEQLSIVASDFFIGGMEYPNLVMISQSLYEINENFPLEYVIAHEVAHQWWYGIIGNNEITEPWLDEALTEYATLMYFEEKYGDKIEKEVYEQMIKAQYENFAVGSSKEEGILRSLKEFDSALEYSSIVYSKGAMFIKELRDQMGDEAFIKALREYFETYKFKNATTEDFYSIIQKNTNKDLKDEFSKWLNGEE